MVKSIHNTITAERRFLSVLPVIIVIVVLVTASMITFMIGRVYSTSRTMYLSMMKLEADSLERRINYLVDPFLANLLIVRDWGSEGLLNDSESRLNACLIPMLRQFPGISSILCATSDGYQYTLQAQESTWVTGTVKKGKDMATWKRWTDARTAVKEWTSEMRRAPWLLSWYKGEMENNGGSTIYWSPLAILELEGKPGFSVAARWTSEKGVRGLVAFSFLSEVFSKAVHDVMDKEEARYFLYNHNDIIFNLKDSTLGIPRKDRVTPSGDQELKAAVAAWKKQGSLERQAFKFSYEGKNWYAEFRPTRREEGRLWAGVLLPESYLLGDMKREMFLLSFLAFLILAAGVLVTAVMIRKYRSSLALLRKKSYGHPLSGEDLKKRISEGESSTLEFKSSLRWDYREEKVNGKLEEVILKSIAAFSNSGGGVLLIGINDEGQPLGLGKDYSTLKNQDKDYFELHLRNLINTEYGIEFATRTIAVSFPVIDGMEICMIEVEKGAEPLFTSSTDKGGQKVEKFFVRSGNSSREISRPSEITLYIKKCFPAESAG